MLFVLNLTAQCVIWFMFYFIQSSWNQIYFSKLKKYECVIFIYTPFILFFFYLFILQFIIYSSNTFSDPIGLTNIEYYSSHPVYGSNMNSNCTKNVRLCLYPLIIFNIQTFCVHLMLYYWWIHITFDLSPLFSFIIASNRTPKGRRGSADNSWTKSISFPIWSKKWFR